MNPILELARKIEPDVGRDPVKDPLPDAPAVIGRALRIGFMSAIRSNSDYQARWEQGDRDERCAVLSLVLRRKPRLMLKALDAAELYEAILNIARVAVARLEKTKPDKDLEALLKQYEVQDPRRVDLVARRLFQHPELLDQLTRVLDAPVPFPIVLALELEEIRKSRRERDPIDELPRTSDYGASQAAFDTAEKAQLLGLSLSGGGIRSATFNLGVLQGLADLDLLRHVDYLSTVSGGGYIGGWLVGWIKRAGGIGGIHTVQTMLSPKHSPNRAGEDQAPIRFLREYSNYLTPKAGFFTADTWTLVTEWVRNTLLNQMVLVLLLAGILLLPHALVRFPFPNSLALAEPLIVLSILASALGIGVIVTNMGSFDSGSNQPRDVTAGALSRKKRKRVTRWLLQPSWVRLTVVLSWLLAAFTFTMSHVAGILGHPLDLSGLKPLDFLDSLRWPSDWPFTYLVPQGRPAKDVVDDSRRIAMMLFIGLLLVSLFGRFDRCFYHGRAGRTKLAKAGALGAITVTAVVAALVGGTLSVLFSRVWLGGVTKDAAAQLGRLSVSGVPAWNLQELGHLTAAFVFGPPLLLQVFALAVTIQIGMLGRNLPDERREWWSRLGAWLLIYCFAWILISGIALYGPYLLTTGVSGGKEWLARAGGITWIATTIFGVLSAHSAETGPKEKDSWRVRVMNAVATAAPYVFVFGLLVLIANVLHVSLGSQSSAYPKLDPTASAWLPWLLAIVMLLLALVLAWRFDVNEFSMHHFYKNRLVRCYLGASRLKERTANPFTGFDPEDEVKMATLLVRPRDQGDHSYVGPYPIVNVALNLVGGNNLAWQERKAESFVFTPQFCGYAYNPPDTNDQDGISPRRCTREGYRTTHAYAYRQENGIGLGTALAISGAAANPNMGYHSSPAVSFLMTMFNVRLGWWLGNPRSSKWDQSSPRIGLTYLLKELTGNTTDNSGFVNLSDGGHFENLGVYELVRRRCRYIIACDAGQDPGPVFADLGNAIRKCRTDLGVEIDVPLERMRPLGENGIIRAHGTVGTIRYPDGVTGDLLYIKTTLTQDESVDLLEYSIREPEFPSQSTADQWFDESQFESYRKLGHHSAASLLNTATGRWARRDGLRALFKDLRALWFPPTPAITKVGRKHAEVYDALMERVREAGLQDLDAVLFPDAHITATRAGNGAGVRRLVNRFLRRGDEPGVPRDAFYVVNSLIQLMETVFVDLNIDEESGHPHNEGWLKLFRRWARSPVLQEVWQGSRKTYGDRFQRFCDRTLEMGKRQETPRRARRAGL